MFTGGEPLLQLDAALLAAVHAAGFEAAVETNGTIAPPPGIDWNLHEPEGERAGEDPRRRRVEAGLPAGRGGPAGLPRPGFPAILLQPMDGPDRAANTEAAIAYCLAHPEWRLSVQTHKYIGVR